MYNLLPKSSWLFIFLIFNSFHSTTHLILAGITDFSVGWKGNMAAPVVLSKTIYFYILYLIPLAIRLVGKEYRSARQGEVMKYTWERSADWGVWTWHSCGRSNCHVHQLCRNHYWELTPRCTMSTPSLCAAHVCINADS